MLEALLHDDEQSPMINLADWCCTLSTLLMLVYMVTTLD